MSESDSKSPPEGRLVPQPGRSSGKALASLVLGLLSFCLSLLAGLPAILLGVLALGDIRRSEGRLAGRGLAITGIVLGCLGVLFNFVALIPAGLAVREASSRLQSSVHLKSIGLALHNHEDTFKRLPYPGSETPRAPDHVRGQQLSWRVHLLPYLEQVSLYDQFQLDEPWDSPHNKQLIPQMPEVYRSPNFRSRDFKTVYLGVDGPLERDYLPTTVFGRGQIAGTQFAAMIDGTSNTVMVVEADADRAVIWTQPDDWQLDEADPRRGLGGLRPGGFLALFADGSVDLIPASVSDADARRLFLLDDREPLEGYVPPAHRPAD